MGGGPSYGDGAVPSDEELLSAIALARVCPTLHLSAIASPAAAVESKKMVYAAPVSYFSRRSSCSLYMNGEELCVKGLPVFFEVEALSGPAVRHPPGVVRWSKGLSRYLFGS